MNDAILSILTALGGYLMGSVMYAYLLPRWIGDWILNGITRLNQLRRRLRWALFKR